MIKRKISAKELARDVRSGMELSALMEKYQLSYDRLKPVVDKLLEMGAVKPEEVQRLAATKSAEKEPSVAVPQAPVTQPSPPSSPPPRPRERDTVPEPIAPLPHVP